MTKKIKALITSPLKDEYNVRVIDDTLDEFKNIIKTRTIEAVKVFKNVICLIDEDGKLKRKEPNFFLKDDAYEHISDIVVGTAIFVGVASESFRSLSEEETRDVLQYLKKYKILDDLTKERKKRSYIVSGIGGSIQYHRLLRNMSIKELADKLNVTSATISRYEHDLRTPSYSTLLKLSEVLGVHILDLLWNFINYQRLNLKILR